MLILKLILAGTLMKTISSAVGVLLSEAMKLEATYDEPTLRNELDASLKVGIRAPNMAYLSPSLQHMVHPYCLQQSFCIQSPH